jgi:hypothetical protein
VKRPKALSPLIHRHARRHVVARHVVELIATGRGGPLDGSGMVAAVQTWRGVLPSGELVTRPTLAGLVAAGVPTHVTRRAAWHRLASVRYALDGIG